MARRLLGEVVFSVRATAAAFAPWLLVACEVSTGTTGESRAIDAVDAGARTGDAGDAGVPDGSLADSVCDVGPIRNVVGSRAPASEAEAGGPPAVRQVDGGFLFSTPRDPCVTYARPPCPDGPRWIFGCPTAVGPGGSSSIHAGDSITVTVPVTDEGLASYSCNGVGAEDSLGGVSSLFYAVKPAYVQVTGRIPPSAKAGIPYHFAAVASGSRYTSGDACAEDLTRLDFDVVVE